MSSSVFEPLVIRTVCRNALPVEKRAAFEKDWEKSVQLRLSNWEGGGRRTQTVEHAQLEWTAHVMAYVDFIYQQTRVHGNAKLTSLPTRLPLGVPVWGPRFIPPSYLNLQKRNPGLPSIEPRTAYLKPVFTVHPFYFGSALLRCPGCNSEDRKIVSFDSWISTGHRELFGIRHGECAIGFQVRCKACHQSDAADQHCWSTSSAEFWRKWEFWQIPRGIPIFFIRSALTRDLFDLVMEMRLKSTSERMEKQIRQLHLLEAKQRELEFYRAFQLRNPQKGELGNKLELQDFVLGTVNSPRGPYDDRSISHDFISDVYLEHDRRTRHQESDEFLTTLTGECLSIDATFKCANKATLATSKKVRVSVLKGGLLTVLNERNEIIAWRLCQTQTNAEIEELFNGLVARYKALKLPLPEQIIADNCCHVDGCIRNKLPDAHVALDVFHFVARYTAVIWNGSRNSLRGPVAKDISNAILLSPAKKGSPAKYRTKEEQEVLLQAAYERWAKTGRVWTAAAAQVHADQLRHVKKGCLERRREDIAADGSRIEGSHKAWNSIQQSHAGGLEMFLALAHDFVLRWNARCALKHAKSADFSATTYGCHHLRLCNAINVLHNSLVSREQARGVKTEYKLRAVLTLVNSGEKFGLTKSDHSLSFGGLLTIKEELDDEELLLATIDDLALHERPDHVGLKLDPSLPSQPVPAPALAPPTTTAHTSLSTAAVALLPNRTAVSPSDASTTLTPSTGSAAIAHALSLVIHPQLPTSASLKHEDVTSVAGPLHTSGPHNIIDLTGLAAEVEPNAAAVSAAALLKTARSSGSTQASSVVFITEHPDALSSTHKRKIFDATPDDEIEEVPSRSDAREQKRPRQADLFQLFAKHAKPKSCSGKLPDAAATTPSFAQPTQPPPCEPAEQATGTVGMSRRMQDLLVPVAAPPAELGLSRSERLFRACTDMNPKALVIQSGGPEWFLFMELRAKHQWASHNLNSRKYVEITDVYNRELAAQSIAAGTPIVKKSPRALMDRLAEVEATVHERVAAGNYKAHTSGNTEFWEKHCAAVPLGRDIAPSGKVRKPQTCGRCRTVKYTGGKGSASNHKKMFCSDGVKTKDTTDTLPDWPQPAGVFSGGSHFHPLVFLTTIRLLYDSIRSDGADAARFDLETLAFAKMVHARSVVRQPDGAILFRLFEFMTLSPNLPELLFQHEGKRYLIIHCMAGSTFAGVPSASATLEDGHDTAAAAAVVLVPISSL